jgi:GDSL-like lipase/acylhydrolase family protein
VKISRYLRTFIVLNVLIISISTELTTTPFAAAQNIVDLGPFEVKPDGAPAGVMVELKQIAGCPEVPAGARGEIQVHLRNPDGSFDARSFDYSVSPEGAWGGAGHEVWAPTISDPEMGFGPRRPGQYKIHVQCVLYDAATPTGRIAALYDEQTLQLTAEERRLELSSTWVKVGGTVRVSSPSSCAPFGKYAHIYGMGGGISAVTVPQSSGGTWKTVTLKVDSKATAGQRYIYAACGDFPPSMNHQYDLYPESGPALVYKPAKIEIGYPSVRLALGDSYSSGEANPPFDKGTDERGRNLCHRSSSAWPRLLGVTADHHLACSGATVHTMYESRWQETYKSSQVSRLAAIEKSLARNGGHITEVTITVGGNDVGFADILGDCFLRECLAHPEDNLTRVGAAQTAITTVLADIRKEAPYARIRLVGYPRLFPTRQQDNYSCGWLTPKERTRANELGLALEDAQRAAARDAGVGFISIRDALDGHELCAKDSWFFPVNPVRYKRDQRQGHPVLKGQKAIADSVAGKL